MSFEMGTEDEKAKDDYALDECKLSTLMQAILEKLQAKRAASKMQFLEPYALKLANRRLQLQKFFQGLFLRHPFRGGGRRGEAWRNC